MSKKLSENEIKKRLLRLHNLEKMYENQVKANQKLKDENKRLKTRVAELEAENRELKDRVEKLELIVEELHAMIFKKKKNNKQSNAEIKKDGEKRKPKKRNKESYRRAIPSEIEVSDEEVFGVDNCIHCGGLLSKVEEVIRYVEDIILPKNGVFPLKKVTKQRIQKGYCFRCKKRSYGKEIPSQYCTLGEGVKGNVVYGIVSLGLSYEQLRGLLETMANIKISDGEIVNILKRSARNLTGEYEEMKERIRGGVGVHYDETVRNVQSGKEKRYGWVMTGTDGIERVYLLGESRGGGNAKSLKGDSEAVGISDNYPVYKNLFKHRQLCRSHPIRKMRDLVDSKKLNQLQIEQCKASYDGLRESHKLLLKTLEKGDFSETSLAKIFHLFDESTVIRENDPEKMVKIKEGLQRDKEDYFTCLKFRGIPTTNNTAERVLRPLVIKRKLSFGSKTSDGARMMEIIYSIVYSLLAETRNNFFGRYLALLG